MIKKKRRTVLEYLQKVRIEASKKALEAGRKPVEEIMTDVGYADSQTFRELFKEVTGLTPLQYRKGIVDDRPLTTSNPFSFSSVSSLYQQDIG